MLSGATFLVSRFIITHINRLIKCLPPLRPGVGGTVILLMMMCGIAAMAQSVLPLPTFIGPPPVSLGSNSLTAGADSIMLPFPIRQAFPLFT